MKKNNTMIRLIKIFDIGYITTLYFVLGISFAQICDKYFGPFDLKEEEKKPLSKSISEIILFLWGVSIVIYFVRNIIPLIPFPLEGVYGFEHLRVKEVTSAGMFSLAFYILNKYYRAKITYISSMIG
uniref:Uncharacterized protein n=1 Tax=viral metagenome TaxID=1070528 RepID=A0A6C0IFQ4_9ZZZZ